MNKLVCAAAVLLVTSLPVYGAAGPTCDQASLTQMETDIGSLGGKEQKKAKKQLDKAKQALKDGKTKKCNGIMKRIQASLKPSSSAPAAGGNAAPDQDSGDDSDSTQE
jgi:hypothetical protein